MKHPLDKAIETGLTRWLAIILCSVIIFCGVVAGVMKACNQI